MRRNPLSYENRFEPEPMKRYPRSRLVASLTAPPRQRAQEARMVESPHRFRVIVVEHSEMLCKDGYYDTADNAERTAAMRALMKPGVITLITDLKNNNVNAEGLLHIYSAFTFVHRLGDKAVIHIREIVKGSGGRISPWAVYENSYDRVLGKAISPQTTAAYSRLLRAIDESGIRNMMKDDWKRPYDPNNGENKLFSYIRSHTNSDMARKGKIKRTEWDQAVADWIALTEMPSARARTGRGEPWLVVPPKPGEYAPEDEEILSAWANAINTYFPPFAQSMLSDFEGSVFDITVCSADD